MKIMGTVRQICTKEEGQTASGNFWEKQTLVLNMTAGERNDIPVAITFFGERKTKILKDLQVGQLIEVVCLPESRWFPVDGKVDGKWFTDLLGFGIIPYQKVAVKAQSVAEQADSNASEQSAVRMPDET